MPHLGVWLTTVSTVVAIAAGMFSVRDSIWEPEPEARPAPTADSQSPSANPASVDSGYRDGIAKVCRQLTSDERARAMDARMSTRRLAGADTGFEQADALLLVATRIKDRSLRSLARFKGLETPGALLELRFTLVRAWDRNIAVLQAHEARLRDAETYGDLVRAARRSNARRTAVDRDWGRITSGLSRLGGTPCDRPRLTTPPIRLRAPVTAGASSNRSQGARDVSSVPLEVAAEPDKVIGPAFDPAPQRTPSPGSDPNDVPDPPTDVAPEGTSPSAAPTP